MYLLTQSSLATFRRCPRQYFYRYEMRLVRQRIGEALRLGAAFHIGQELRGSLGDYEAIERAAAQYDVTPQWADPFDWQVEHQTLRALLSGYFWRYEADTLETIETESAWQLPLRNPDGGAPSRTYALAGKIDKIVRLTVGGRPAIKEYKTAGEDISDASDYWPRLRFDAQISAYVYAARHKGFEVETVLYDVTRKPEIAPKQIPVLDEQGRKIVLDGAGNRVFNASGDPRQSANSENGWKLKTTRETPEAFGKRLLEDIGKRPDFYFARREIPRLSSDLDEFAEEVWQQSQQLHQSRTNGLWFRNVSPTTCRNCEYKDICLQGVQVDPANPPKGFEITPFMHPELEERNAS
jgi:hypothetical protein